MRRRSARRMRKIDTGYPLLRRPPSSYLRVGTECASVRSRVCDPVRPSVHRSACLPVCPSRRALCVPRVAAYCRSLQKAFLASPPIHPTKISPIPSQSHPRPAAAMPASPPHRKRKDKHTHRRTDHPGHSTIPLGLGNGRPGVAGL